jgi:phosphoribosylformylglycinamidine synthase subunit PurL
MKRYIGTLRHRDLRLCKPRERSYTYNGVCLFHWVAPLVLASPSPFTAEQLQAHRLTPSEYEQIVRLLGRHPNLNELGMFSVMWSEHCCYKNSKPLLRNFPTTGPRILVGPGENAGVVDFGDGLRVAFKIESHNHPSAVEPYQGAATGVGGILRDIFTMGARPIASLNALRFGPLDNPRNRHIFSGVVAGISGYGNSVGVPTIGGEIYFDETYSGNPLVNAMAIGLMETEEIVVSGAEGEGNPVLYVGSTTGRDGMGGASFASAELTDKSEKDRPAVQVGDPFLEKLLIEACLEAFKTGAVVAAQDMGAAGLTCSTAEMASKGGVGIELNLDLVPVRERGMSAYEFLLSESQERMLFVAHKGREQELIEIFHRWGLQAVVAGRVITESIVRILHQGSVVVEIPATSLTEEAPVYPRDVLAEPPAYAQEAWAWDVKTLAQPTDWAAVLLKLLDSPTIASKKWVYRQYDSLIQGNSLVSPGAGDAAVIRLQTPTGITRGLAATVDCNSRYVYLDPYEGGKAAVAEAARNLSCVGAEPVAVTDNLNFGSPEKPEVYWQMAEACRGISEACSALGTPVTGGNVSLYNETQGQPIYPTPVIGMVGILDDLEKHCTLGFKKAGDLVYLLGQGGGTLGASEYLKVIHGLATGRPPQIDLGQEQKVQSTCRLGIRQGWIRSAHDISEGGLLVALAESAMVGDLGVRVEMSGYAPNRRWDERLFGEAGAQIIVTVRPEDQEVWEAFLREKLGADWHELGIVSARERGFCVVDQEDSVISATIEELTQSWTMSIPQRMAHLD